MLYLLVNSPENLYAELIERVIVAATCLHRPPGIAALHTALHTDGIDLLIEGLALLFIFHLQQQLLTLQFK